MNNLERFAKIKRLSSVLRTTYMIMILVLLFAIFADISELNLIQRALNGAVISESEANGNDFRQTVIGGIQFLLWIFAFVVFLIWYHKSYENLKSLYGHDNEYSGALAIGNFFIPIISLWRPLQSTREIWKTSKPKGEDHKNQAVFESGFMIVNIWWILFLMQNYVGQFLLRSAFNDETLWDIYNTSWVTLGSDILDIPLILLELFIVLKVTSWQGAKTRKMALSYSG